MATIQVSIDDQGNISGGDLSGKVGDPVTWAVTWAGAQGTINIGPAAGKTFPFSGLTAPGRGNNNQWSATILSAGDYSLGDSQGKVRTPRISIVVPKAMSK